MLQIIQELGSSPESDRRQGMSNKLREAEPYIFLLLLSLLVYLPVMTRAAAAKPDFGIHIEIALELPDSTDHTAHVLYHALFLSIHQLTPSTPYTSIALWAVIVVMLPVPMMVFALLGRAARGALPTSFLMAVSIALTIIAPITIWTNRYMVGYINPIVYHSPTMILVRLFVIPLSLLTLRIFQGLPYRSLNQRVYILLLSAVLVLLSILAKPSFAFALLPGCCLYALWRFCRRQPVDWLLLIGGFCIPGAFLLGLLYLIGLNNKFGGFHISYGFSGHSCSIGFRFGVSRFICCSRWLFR